ncbi:MAG: TrbC/VirB2 family protein [Fulvimarina manganoxydans]|uniref:TrbC/VirB2 family protein n=1 Tax=Fulvimarina manganoxydans TaxID=937218 RepID=UPI0023533106|nr:TrbC/VirB2 family protein [Fulvimarina manganoxydans]MCK5930971.1 TrbC/VirB2 family protein [Fulvimarina manganoxydans]
MKSRLNTLLPVFVMTLLAAEPALAQALDLSPVQALLQGLIDIITGPLGIAIGTLALIGVFLSWLFGIVDFRQAMWTIVGIAGVAAAPTIVGSIWSTT